MRLTELGPHMEDHHPNEHGYQMFSFLCPSCRMLRESVGIWPRPAAEVKWKDAQGNEYCQRVWQGTQGPYKDWDTLSLTPSVNIGAHKSCPGWHGFITDGEIK